MKLYSEEERRRRLKIIEDLVKSESWKIIQESVEFWSYAKAQELVQLYANGRKLEAEDMARQIWAVKKVFDEPRVIVQQTSSWLKNLDWMRKLTASKERKDA